VLVVLMLLALWLNSRIRNARATHRLGPGPARPPRAYPLGRWRWPALAGCGLLALVALVLPVAVLVYWSTKGISAGSTTMEFAAGLAANSLMTGVRAAIFGALARARARGVGRAVPLALSRAQAARPRRLRTAGIVVAWRWCSSPPAAAPAAIARP
jgi:iron(III) transport system permease protein